MNDSVSLANAVVTKLLLQTLYLFEVISTTSDTITVHENGIQNPVSIDEVMLALYTTRINEGTDRDSNLQNANRHRDGDITDKNDATIIEEFPVQRIVRHVGTGRQVKCTVQWYGYRPDQTL